MCTSNRFRMQKSLQASLRERIASLQQFPERRSVVKEITSQQLREIRLYHYRIIYRCLADKVQVITIHHSARLLLNNPHLGDA
ncbi:MAG: type II toxin-antitoxin system RelE/ParE family toxin [Chitinophagaceae bacterium]|nr:MAG: type II toxin-antitoxin system RelE/ParE family toxin [Chitinophagaceae bacterium]